LSPEEEGVYLRLVNFYYDTENPIPAKTDRLFRRLRLENHMVIAEEMLHEFFTLDDGFWHHKRCECEISEYHRMVDTNRVNGKRGGRPRGSKDKQQRVKKEAKNPVGYFEKPTITQSVTTINHKPLTNIKDLSSDADPPTDIFNYWVSVMGKQAGQTKFTPKRKKAVQARLRDGYTVDQIKTAILNCRGDPWSMGANDRQTPFNDLELICRSGEKLESFIEKQNPGGGYAKTRSGGDPGANQRKPTPAERARALREDARHAAAGSPTAGVLDTHAGDVWPPVGQPAR